MTLNDSAPRLGGQIWNTFTPETRLTAKEYIEQITVLLQGVLASNGNQQPPVLIDQLRATLSLGGPQSSMPLPSTPTRPTLEFLTQATQINDHLVVWANDALQRVIADPKPLPGGPLRVRSHCYGHNLVPPAIDILLGPQGGPVPMMLFNEWIHQMVLLRDALLPFANWQNVPLPVDARGLRRLEPSRDLFLSELLIRQIRHTSVVAYARDVTVPGHANHTPGYGFRYSGGSVLPAVVFSPSVFTSTDLLTWSPDQATEEVSTLVYREDNYFEAARTEADKVAKTTVASTLAQASATVLDEVRSDGDRNAWIEVAHSAGTARVDLGQALRGHRYAYRTQSAEATSEARTASSWLARATPLDARAALTAPGLIWNDAGDYLIDAGIDGLAVLALLGALFPENVVIRRASETTDPRAVGKTGPASFVITVPDQP